MNCGYNNRPYVEIVEQPAGKSLRFRYICEGRSAGSIPGVNSTSERKTFPSIRIVGYKGRAVVVVSCVTKDQPYRPHPHNLVGKDSCNRGVCTIEVFAQNSPILFSNLGIQCVKKKEIADALKLREEIRVDPYRNGSKYINQSFGIDLNAVRLCFQVFLEGPTEGKFGIPLDPVVSDPIYDKKTTPELVICKLSHCSAPIHGGMEMIILCEKIVKDDIQVVFFEKQNGHRVWEGYGEFHSTDVHKQAAISLRTPAYNIQQVNYPIQVSIQLRRPSDGEISDALPFTMIPSEAVDPIYAKRKRQKFNTSSSIIDQTHRSQCTCNNYPELVQYNSSIEAGISNNSKDNYRMTLLRRLHVEAEKNDDLKNQLAENNCNYMKLGMPYSTVNNTDVTKYPNIMSLVDINDVPSAHHVQPIINPSDQVPVPEMANNYGHDRLQINNPRNIPTAYCSPINQPIYNGSPMLYRVTSEKQESISQQQQQQQQQHHHHHPYPQSNYVTNNPAGMTNQMNIDNNNPLNQVGNSTDYFVDVLSASFFNNVSLTDVVESIQTVEQDSHVAHAPAPTVTNENNNNNNNWLGYS